jgi:hypothetical protein
MNNKRKMKKKELIAESKVLVIYISAGKMF